MNLKDIVKPIDAQLEEFDRYFKNLMKSKVSLLDIIIKYITKKKGKRIRPAITFLSAELCGGVTQRTFYGASMVELLHTATLIHDDVVDNSQKRRGLASINYMWSNKVAVLIGDYLLAKGLLVSIDNDEFDFLKALSHAVRRMSEGELLQIQKSKELDITEETYFKIISDKTASLIATCCEVGAISATPDRDVHKQLREFGENLGIAFQIRDDIFDYLSKASKIGKPVGNDLKEKKITLPLLYAFTKVTKNVAKQKLKIIKDGDLKRSNINEIVNFVIETGGIDYAEQKAKEYHEKALNILENFRDSEAKTSLINLSNFFIEREI